MFHLWTALRRSHCQCGWCAGGLQGQNLGSFQGQKQWKPGEKRQKMNRCPHKLMKSTGHITYHISIVIGAGALLGDAHAEAGQAAIFVSRTEMEGPLLAGRTG